MIQGLVIFLSLLSFLVVFHEWGHYAVARLCGIRVERFSIGFGPVLFARQWGETEFCFSLIPMGGYVKLAGESPETSSGAEGEFEGKPLWQRASVVVAGPILNAVLAMILFWGVGVWGLPVRTAVIGGLVEGFPAQAAGIRAGDKILTVNDEGVRYWDESVLAIRKTPAGKPVRLGLERDGARMRIDVAPKPEEGSKKSRKPAPAVIGIRPSDEQVTVRYGGLEAAGLAVKKWAELTGLILYSLGMVVTGALPFKESMAGPVGIYMMTQQQAHLGLMPLLEFAGRLSVSLFVLNLFPIPALDGGHLLFHIYEALTGRRPNDRVREWAHRIGFALLMLLMASVIVTDILKYGFVDKIIKGWGRL